MTDEQIEAVKQGDENAMDFVEQGEATLIEFSRDHIIGRCGKEKRNLEQSSADEGGGWENVAYLIDWESISDLLCDSPVIVPGQMRDETVVAFIDQMQFALASVGRNEDEIKRDYDSLEEASEE